MKFLAAATAALLVASPVLAEGDVEAGEKGFKKCKACHTIASPDGEVIFKGGKTGPNLYGVIGRAVGSEDFKYGAGLQSANEAGAVWTEEMLAAYVVDPKAWLSDNGYETKSKMTFKLKKGGEDVAAYLASVAPAAE
ncbi:cytochrome C [Shimia sp. R9_1]|uniref:c-type cytochrome n=1 Tax=unclassified Shimia TaxID=2630038 RepID=UPI001AD9B2FD|nr:MULTISPECIES: cytochrome C [unclassified Shimia]MBO9398256.1 cytochrome C [Shimia sp. R9_2]MBO9406737.1 cytochrome C [Shimia sp. R9_1]